MSGGIGKLVGAMRALYGATKATSAELEALPSKVTKVTEETRKTVVLVQDTIPAVSVALQRQIGLVAGANTALLERGGASPGPTGDTVANVFGSERDSTLVGYNVGQQERIADIEGTIAGQYLEEYARIIQFLKNNRNTSAEGLQVVARLKRDLGMYEQLVRQYAGQAGAGFNFQQFRRDLERAMTEQIAITDRDVVGASSGTLGRKRGGGCEAGPSLNILRHQGALR